jgi:hypothetical protein
LVATFLKVADFSATIKRFDCRFAVVARQSGVELAVVSF